MVKFCKISAILIINILNFSFLLAESEIDRILNIDNPASHYIIEQWTTENGLPQNSINGIVQTDDDYLWLATFDGLVRFDGQKFTIFNMTNTPALRTNRITSICKDSKNNLWIGTESRDIFIYKDGIINSFKLPDKYKFDYTARIINDKAGNIWLATSISLFKIYEKSIKKVYPYYKLKCGYILNIYPSKDNKIYVVGTDGLTIIENDKIEPYKILNDIEINSIFETSEGALWLGGGDKFYKFSDGLVESFSRTITKGYDKIISFWEDENKIIWIGDGKKGLKFFKNNKIYDGKINSLHYTNIKNIISDHEGNIWLGTDSKGLFKLKKRGVYNIGPKQNFFSSPVYPILIDSKEAMWIGTTGEGIIKLSNGKCKTYEYKDNLSNLSIWSLFEDSKGNIWCGSYGNGAFRFSKGRFIQYNKKNNALSNDIVFSIYEDSKKNLWFGTLNGLNLLKKNKFKVFKTEDGLANNEIRHIFEDSKKVLWIGTYSGLSYYKDGKFGSYNEKDGLPCKYIRYVYEDKKGNLWLGSYGGGLIYFKNGKFISITKKQGLFDNLVSTIIEDDFGYMWMTCNRGIYKVKVEELYDCVHGKKNSINCFYYGTFSGMESVECNGGCQPSSWKAKDGTLLFPTVGGVAVVYPENLVSNNRIPKVYIEKVFVDGKIVNKLNKLNKLVIQPGYNNFRFNFTALSFKTPQNVKIKYKLEGIDAEWYDASTDRYAIYRHIPPGTYKFHVIACNNEGIWNYIGASLTVEVKAFFFKTVWFYLIIFLLIICLVIILTQIRIKKIKQRKDNLERIVEERTKNLLDEKHKTELALQEVKKAEESIRKSEEQLRELNATKDKFFSLIAHDLKNPLVVFTNISDLITRKFNELSLEEIKDLINEINDSSKNLYKLLENLLQWARSQTGKMKYMPDQINLYELISESIYLFQNNADNKFIKIISEIEDPLYAFGDYNMVNTIIRNLVSNAIKFTSVGGTVKILSEDSSDSVKIIISDTGIGISEENIQKLFKIDDQFYLPGTAGEKGTGLGLALCKEFIERNMGKIWVESIEDEGSSFIFTLPKDENSKL